jgi:hypothetical protein
VKRRLLGYALAGVMTAAASGGASAWSPASYFYGRPGGGYSSGQGLAVTEGCDPQPAYTESCTVNPDEDVRTYATVKHVTHVIPRRQRNVEHVYHRLNRVHHVIHNVNQDVYVQNVRVHHNVTTDRTMHHYRHRTNYIQQDTDENVYQHENLPDEVESDCR